MLILIFQKKNNERQQEPHLAILPNTLINCNIIQPAPAILNLARALDGPRLKNVYINI
jgi:hypothetical protein